MTRKEQNQVKKIGAEIERTVGRIYTAHEVKPNEAMLEDLGGELARISEEYAEDHSICRSELRLICVQGIAREYGVSI